MSVVEPCLSWYALIDVVSGSISEILSAATSFVHSCSETCCCPTCFLRDHITTLLWDLCWLYVADWIKFHLHVALSQWHSTVISVWLDDRRTRPSTHQFLHDDNTHCAVHSTVNIRRPFIRSRDVRTQMRPQAFWASADRHGRNVTVSCGRRHALKKSWIECQMNFQ